MEQILTVTLYLYFKIDHLIQPRDVRLRSIGKDKKRK